ncbi:cupin domain-containing protein [Mucilaginibacter robiniae]|uniref:Cupin domain-containing protein n=1 Tax=Mucilaginibacter robiniae TaxID=2728022 RepID=A0A7L5DZB5_9SPHI|nr:cupin domain-containing protein [Mucilaginibacter robiniae]QJD96335.1 cupin domain-containing protein [Mucilaginibacter robiniae]
MTHSSLFQQGPEIAWQYAGEGVERQILGYDASVMMVKVRFDADGIGATHSHPHTQVTYIESGVFEMTIGDTTQVLRKGDGYYVPPNTQHGIICLEAGELVDTFSPCREDFLPK